MPAGFDAKITGAQQLARLARDLKIAGRNDLRREMLRGLRQAARPAAAAIRESAREKLPKRGGLADLIAEQTHITVRSRTSANRAGVFVITTDPHDIGRMNRGILRHPVFGNRDVWVGQAITPGWWTDPLLALEPNVQREMAKVLNDVARKLEQG